MPPFASQQPNQEITPTEHSPELTLAQSHEKTPTATLLVNTNENSALMDKLTIEKIEEFLSEDVSTYPEKDLQIARGNFLRIKANVDRGIAPLYNVMSVEKKTELIDTLSKKIAEVDGYIENSPLRSPEIQPQENVATHANVETIPSDLEGVTVSELHGDVQELFAEALGGGELNLEGQGPKPAQQEVKPETFDDLTKKKEKLLAEISQVSGEIQLYSSDEQVNTQPLHNKIITLQEELRATQIKINNFAIENQKEALRIERLNDEQIHNFTIEELKRKLTNQRGEKLNMTTVISDEDKLLLENVNSNIAALTRELDLRASPVKPEVPKSPEGAPTHQSKILRPTGFFGKLKSLFGKK